MVILGAVEGLKGGTSLGLGPPLARFDVAQRDSLSILNGPAPPCRNKAAVKNLFNYVSSFR